MNAFDRTLADHGATPDDLLRFDTDEAELLPYATLAAARQAGDNDLVALEAVYEWQGSPLAFLIDGSALRDDTHLQAIRRRLALRGDAPYLGVVGAGTLTIHRIALDAARPAQTRLTTAELPAAVPATFAYLANRRPGLELRRRWIADVVLTLLGKAIDALIEEADLADDDAISLVGRALFTRFLRDRDLLPPHLLTGQPAECLFDNAANAEAASRWLDDTFNGDLLPYSHGLFKHLPKAAFARLGDILHGTPGSQRYLDWKEDWAHLDFAHIPVGVLSQAYEHYQRRHTKVRQKREGGYYTPRPLAELLIRGAFHALRQEGRAHDARVLDPAAGAGVFLLAAFRQLVAERWRHDGKRPGTETLRDILYRQIAGFDINEAGLRFAALGLYLLSIELDPHPEPVQKLAFKKLRDSVLFKVGEEGSLGSLGPAVGDEHNGRYDLVIGNPPWASATGLADWPEVTARVHRIANARLPADGPAPRLPNEVLDLPFVWRAMEWARPGGQIAFALHGRLLFQQGNGMDIARAALFRAMDVTGVVNGADLCQTPVWPQIGVPFCLLYARNEPPPPGAGLRYVSPRLEKGLNDNGQLRLDADNAATLSPQQVAERPEILKLLYRGGPLGLEVFDRLTARGIGTLADYVGRSGLIHGNGYQKLRQSTKKPLACGHLSMLPELPVGMPLPLLVDLSVLLPFDQPALHRIRNEALFRGPLLIIHESPPSQSGRIDVTVSDGDVVFNQSFHGYSAATHANSSQLVRYLALVVGSKPALWHTLITSGRLGFDRRIIEKFILDTIPVPPFDQLLAADRKRINPLFDAIANGGGEAAWAEADDWVAKLYGLRARDLEVIADTLRFELPFAAQRQSAQQPPSTAERKTFRAALEAELRPWAQRSGRPLEVDLVETPNGSPWGLLRIDTGGGAPLAPGDDWPEVLRLADRLAGSEVLLPESDGAVLWLARLSQARYWSRSAARLAARRIVWEHADGLFGGAAA